MWHVFILFVFTGEGSYSVVYKVIKHKDPKQTFACKRYKINKETKKWIDRCLNREMEISMLAKHRNIVETYEVYNMKNDAYLIMKYAPKGSIRAYIRALPEKEFMPEIKVRDWLSDIFSAIAFLHGKQIAHRDIKCENFLLDEESRPLVCDFSFACISTKEKTRFDCMVDTVCGTSSYMAPEVHALPKRQVSSHEVSG